VLAYCKRAHVLACAHVYSQENFIIQCHLPVGYKTKEYDTFSCGWEWRTIDTFFM